jgi:multiple sugar transport system substrate-binding protein
MTQESSNRRPMKRRDFLGGIAVAAGSAVLAACGASVQPGGQVQAPTAASGEQPAQATAAPPADNASGTNPATIRWEFRGSQEDLDRTKVALEKFTAQQPNIKVNMELAPDQQRDEKLVAAMVGGTAPDVFEAWGDIVYKFADKEQVLDLQPFVDADLTQDDIKDFYQWQWDGFREFNNIRFGMPKYVNIMCLLYNKDLFDAKKVEYPSKDWTHDDYANAMRKLTEVKDGVTERWGAWIPAWNWDRFWYRLDMWGGNVRDANDNTKSTLSDPKSQAALEWSRALMWDEKVLAQPSSAGPNSWSSEAFFPQKVAMCEDGTYPQSLVTNIAGKFKWAYQHVPKGPAGIRKVLGTTDGFLIWKGTKNPDAAWTFMKFLSGPEYQEDQVRTTGLLPVRFSVLDKWEQINTSRSPELKDANLKWAVEALQEGYPGARRTFKNQNAAAELINPALEKVYTVGDTPVSYLGDLDKQIPATQQ